MLRIPGNSSSPNASILMSSTRVNFLICKSSFLEYRISEAGMRKYQILSFDFVDVERYMIISNTSSMLTGAGIFMSSNQ
jgi:hypothetical protein